MSGVWQWRAGRDRAQGAANSAEQTDAAREFWSGRVERFAIEARLNAFYALRAELASQMLGPTSPQMILEVGFGSGLLASRVCALGHQLVGLELSAQQLERARQCCGEAKADLRLGGLEALRDGERFDAVLAIGVLPYISHQPRFLQALADRLLPHGRLIVSITRPASLYAWAELMRHMRHPSRSRRWFWIASNLIRTGIWSGGFVGPDVNPIRSVRRLDNLLAPWGLRPIDQFSLFNIARLDRCPRGRSSLAALFSARLGWCTVAAYERA